MAVPIKMPDLGTTVEEFTIMAWRISEGDTVSLGDELADIETDKAVTALESTTGGVVLRLCCEAGELVHTGDTLAYIGQAGEIIAETPAVVASSATPAIANATTAPAAKPASPVAPVVRNLAAKMGVDLATLAGTGQGGTITREDVLRASRERAPVAAPEAPQAGVPLSRGQAAVARAVTKSWTEIPHFSVTASIDMHAARRLRADAVAQGRKLSYDAIVLRAMAKALDTMPGMAATLDGDRLIAASGIHLALAIDRQQELTLPVLRDVNTKSLAAIQAEIDEILAQLQAGALRAERLQGGCMTLSNLGMYAIDAFTPIIFPGHSAILAMAAIQDRPVALAGQLEIRPMATVTLTCDHRLINGRMAAEFVTSVKTLVERVKGEE